MMPILKIQFSNENLDFLKLVSATMSLTAFQDLKIFLLRDLSSDIKECNFWLLCNEMCQHLKVLL